MNVVLCCLWSFGAEKRCYWLCSVLGLGHLCVSKPRLEAAVNLLVGIKYNYGGVRTALKASIAVVHQLKSQIPFFIPVNQTSQGLKCLTQPGDSAVRHCWGCGGGGSDLKRQIELFHCTKYRHRSRSGVYCRMKNSGGFHWNMKPFFA